jgi:hypothetical protein
MTKTKKIVYVGPIDKVALVVDGREQIVAHGDTLELPAELAESLLEQQGNWVPVPAAANKKKEE